MEDFTHQSHNHLTSLQPTAVTKHMKQIPMEVAGKTDHSEILLQNISAHSQYLIKQVDAKLQSIWETRTLSANLT